MIGWSHRPRVDQDPGSEPDSTLEIEFSEEVRRVKIVFTTDFLSQKRISHACIG